MHGKVELNCLTQNHLHRKLHFVEHRIRVLKNDIVDRRFSMKMTSIHRLTPSSLNHRNQPTKVLPWFLAEMIVIMIIINLRLL